MNKSPAFQWYAKDFLSDLNVIRMSASEVGAYVLLISVCWVEEVLPNDLDDLALIARMPIDEFKKSWSKHLSRCFVLNEKTNTFFHPRLQKEFQKQKDFRKKKSDAGKASGRKRKANKELSSEQVFDSVQTKDEQNRTLHTAYCILHTAVNEETQEQGDLPLPSQPNSTQARSHPVSNFTPAAAEIEANLEWLCQKKNLVTLKDEKEWLTVFMRCETEKINFKDFYEWLDKKRDKQKSSSVSVKMMLSDSWVISFKNESQPTKDRFDDSHLYKTGAQLEAERANIVITIPPHLQGGVN